jgi:DNA-binding HxlR family transcriptional regulator
VKINLDPSCVDGCPVGVAADILDGKWTTRIVRDLLSGKKRFSQLQKGMDGISAKVLTERLKMLQENGLVTKTTYPCVPPKTEYELTEMGQHMQDVIVSMAAFGERLAARSG